MAGYERAGLGLGFELRQKGALRVTHLGTESTSKYRKITHTSVFVVF